MVAHRPRETPGKAGRQGPCSADKSSLLGQVEPRNASDGRPPATLRGIPTSSRLPNSLEEILHDRARNGGWQSQTMNMEEQHSSTGTPLSQGGAIRERCQLRP